MQLSKLLKTMAIVLPIMAISACSSTPPKDTDGMGDGQNATATENGVEMGGVAPILTPEEQQQLRDQDSLLKQRIIYFDFDRSQVSTASSAIIKAHGEYLVEHPDIHVVIEGHTDERGTPEYNIALGERRAKAVAKYLQSMGVSQSQMSIVSYGEEKPLDNSRTEEAFAKNRRAVLAY